MINIIVLLLGLQSNDSLIAVSTIVSALITFSGVLLTVIVAREVATISFKGVTHTIKNNTDTNLKANARVEWIQTVRNTSAELISLYYKILNFKSTNEKAENKLFENLIEAQFKTELLILYFGPEVDKYGKHIISPGPSFLGHLEYNEGKNDMIVDFLSELNNDFNAFYSFISNNEIDSSELISKDSIHCAQNEDRYIENGTTMKMVRITLFPILKNDYDDEEEEEEEKIRDYKLSINSLEERLVYLRDIVRIYLKIEWNKAKGGN